MKSPDAIPAWEMHTAALILAGVIVVVIHAFGAVGVLILGLLLTQGCAGDE